MRKLFHGFLFIVQYCFYYLCYPIGNLIYGKKYPWIICERGDDARDNGYWMFKNLNSEHTYVHSYYLIKKSSADYQKVKKIGKVVRYKSLKHWLLYVSAEARLSTHNLCAPGNFIGEYFKRHHNKQKGVSVFLQHGITHNEFPSNYYEYNGTDLFICGAKPEFDHISKNCHYPKENVVYTGFARFDGLHEFETKKQILIMPSCRYYLYGVSKEEFKNSSYFKSFVNLLNNEELQRICDENDIKIVFYPHYSMQQYVDEFIYSLDKNIVIADFDHYDVQNLLKESSLLVTDFSSILFDFAYMKKPEILFQFDENDFYSKHYKHSYFDHKRDGFGEVACDVSEVVNLINKYINNTFKIEDNYLNKINNFFTVYDSLNSERIYQAVVKRVLQRNDNFPLKILKVANVTFVGDDYGRNYEASEGIRQAFKLGYIQRASVMMNKDEMDHINTKDVDINKIGFHFNILEGYQSYGDTSNYAYSVNKDSLARRLNSKKAFFYISKNDKKLIEKELRAQLDLYIKAGFKCEYFDSHGHVHNKLPVAKIIIPILKEYGFSYARIPENIFMRHFIYDTFIKTRAIRLYKKNFRTSDYFVSVHDLVHLNNLKKYREKNIEIMTHPYLNANFHLINRKDINF